MNNIEMRAAAQQINLSTSDKLNRNLRRALNIINAEYQQIDWEDQAFLNRVLNDDLSSFEAKGGNVCQL